MDADSDLINVAKKQPRRSPRNASKPSAALQAAKQKMRERASKEKITEFVKDNYAVAQRAICMVRGKTGIVYDDFMVEHFCTWDKNYPECPERYTSVMSRCIELGLIDECTRIQSREGTVNEILKKHTPQVIKLLESTAIEADEDKLEQLSANYDAVFINNASYKTALLCVGAAVDLVDAVVKGTVQNGLAIIRPPGHHAMKSEYCGYCFFNNVALAAADALDKGVSRILIVDWDVHHGQGTQQMFYDDPRVLYFSIHRYEKGSFWPNLRQSDFDYIGEGAGEGYNFNVPLNAVGMTDADYLAIFQQILLPVAYEYQPELILVSAGYDAAIGCPEGEMEITPACYAHLTSSLMGLAEGKVAVVLEGGYCLKSLSEGAALTLRALHGDPAPPIFDIGPPCTTIVNTILDVIYVHRPFWKSLQVQEVCDVTKGAQVHIPRVEFLGDETRPEKYATRDCYPVQSEEFLKNVDDRLNALRMRTKLTPGPRVGLVADMAMLAHANVAEGDHPEKPERIKAIFERHGEFGLIDRCVPITPRIATDEELLLVHQEEHVKEMKEIPTLTQSELNAKAEKFDSVYLNPKSYDAAILSAGSVLEVCDKVITGDITSGVAVVRPPGHHAEEDAACGFCLFNNVAMAAASAVKMHNLKRVVLLDWDVHHGNGSQRMFENDPRVLYISVHRYNNGRFFPASEDADYDKVGTGPGAGYNINIPWNKSGGGMTDGDYIAAFHSIILPVLYQYNPELILVSAGFDACVNDPLGHCKVTPEAFAHMTHWLLPIAQGKLVLALEGGYNVTSISYAMTLCTKALLGDPLPALGSAPTVPSPSALDTIRNVLRTQQQYWPCLAFNKLLPDVDVLKPARLSKAEKEALNDRLSAVTEGIRTLPGGGGSSSGSGGPGTSKSAESSKVAEGSSSSGPVKTLKEYLDENADVLLQQEAFAVFPLNSCPHLDQVIDFTKAVDISLPCTSCSNVEENWICLTCHTICCGRYANGHMMEHSEEVAHPLCLSFADLSVWCYACEAYVDNAALFAVKNEIHKQKFGSELTWSYGVLLQQQND